MPTYIVFQRLARMCVCLVLGPLLSALPVVATPAAAQVVPRSHSATASPTATLNDGSPSDLIAQGDRESAARRPAAALPLYERAIQLEGNNYAALWKASREAVDLGEFEPTESVRNALYAKATDYARRATAVNPSDAEGHFHLSRAIGRTALALGPKDRIKYAVEVRDQAREALRLAPRHAGALHVLGMWNAEVMRLSGFTRTMARAFLGGKVLDSANWADAQRYLEEAVRIEPTRLVHHLDLARIYRDVGRKDDARAHYQAAIRSSDIDANDDRYRQSAEEELRRLRK